MATIFDSEQWTITRLYDPATYAGIDNVVEVIRLKITLSFPHEYRLDHKPLRNSQICNCSAVA